MNPQSQFVPASAVLFVLSLFLIAPSLTHAQRAGHFAASTPMVMARRGAMQPRSHRGRSSNPTAAGAFSNGFGFFGGSPFFLSPSDPGIAFAPGLGNQDFGIKALIDPATEWRIALAERFRRRGAGFAGSGYYLLDGGGAYEVPVQSDESEQPAPQPQIIVVQAAPPAQQAAEQAFEPAPESQSPLPDVGQFTLVLRNGTQIQAVAFTRANDRIIYITSDGSRRTIAVADLNSDETLRINQERGTPLQLPL